MALAFVQRAAGSGTGSAVVTLTATGAHSLLVAHCSQNDSASFTPPSGSWIKGPTVANSTFLRVEQWYLPNNPGGITSLTFTGTTGKLCRVAIHEWSSAAGTTQQLVARQTGFVAGPVSGITITPPASSDVTAGEYTAAGAYTSAASSTWVEPSGWTGIGAGSSVCNMNDARRYPMPGTFVSNPGAVGNNPSLGCPTSTAGYNYAAGIIGPLDSTKLFYSSGLPTTITDTSGLQGNGQGGGGITALPSNCVPILNFNTYNDPNLTSFVNSITQPVYLLFGNEPETPGKFASYTDFVSKFKTASNTIKAVGNPNVKVMQCSIGYQYHNTVNADAVAGRWIVPAQYVDVYAIDLYQHFDVQSSGSPGGYAWPSAGLSNWDQWLNWLAVVQPMNKPLGIGEYGIDSQMTVNGPGGYTGDPTAAARTTRLNADITYLTAAFTPGGGSAVSAFPMEVWNYWYSNCSAGKLSTNPRTQYQFPSSETSTVTAWKSLNTGGTAAAVDTGNSTNNQGWAGAIGLYEETGSSSAPVITTTSPLNNGAVGQAYSNPAMAATGNSPFTWSNPGSGLPPGISLSSGGVWSGTPTTPGTYTFNIQVTDTNSLTATSSFTITVYPAPSVLTTFLPDGVAAVPYSAGLQAAGEPPFTWAIISGSLPSGLAVDNTAQAIDGVSASPATASFTVQVTDGSGRTASQALTLVIDPAPAPPAPADSLILAGRFELLAGGEVSDDPACAGATFRLGKAGGNLDYDMGMPQPVVDVLAALGLDGERPMGRRASNRTMVLPVVILAPDRGTLAAAREALLSAIDADSFDLEWSRFNAEPLIFDCFRAGATTYDYSLVKDNALVSTMDITFTALPYGRSTDLETMAFPPPSASWPSPLTPVVIDDMTVVSSSNNPASWSASPMFAGGGNGSAHWARQDNACPLYNHTLNASMAIDTRSRISFWLGLTTTTDSYHVWHGGRVQLDITLTDTSGSSAQMAVTVRCACSGKPGVPEWTKISAAVPATTLLDPGNIIGYQVKAWNTTDPGTRNRVLQADAYLSYVTASPAVVGVAGVRGAAYDLRGVIGSARAPLNIQVQPGTGVVQNIYKKATHGTDTFTIPSGTTTAWLECTGPGAGGGSGSAGSANAGGAGGGGGEIAIEPAWPVTPGQVVNVSVGAAGSGGPSPSGGGGGPGTAGTAPTTLSIGGVTIVKAHPGQGGPRGAATNNIGGQAGTGSNNTIHYDGGNGGPPQGTYNNPHQPGSGGGSSAGQFKAGNDGQPTRPDSKGVYRAGTGGAAVDGGGPGAIGGDGTGLPTTPRTGPGGGGGGGYGGGSGTGGGNGFDGQARIIYGTPAVIPITSLILHRPGHSAPPAFQPLVQVGGGLDVPDGLHDYAIIGQVPGVPPKFGGRTYSVFAVAKAFHGTSARNITVTVSQTDGITQSSGVPAGGGRLTSVSVTRSITPSSAPNGVFIVDDIALPPRAIAQDQAGVDYTVSIQSADTADRFLDVLLLDSEGSTVWLDSTGDGFSNIWLDSPEPGLGIGLLLGSPGDRDSASSIMDETVLSGPPFYVEPGDQWLLAYSPTGAPALFASYLPRWFIDRLR